MIRYLIIFIRARTRAYAIHYLKIRDAMKNNKKTLGTPIDGSLPPGAPLPVEPLPADFAFPHLPVLPSFGMCVCRVARRPQFVQVQ